MSQAPAELEPSIFLVAASPSERLALTELLFQGSSDNGNVLRLSNAAEGRAFRRLVAQLGLAPIVEAMRVGELDPKLSRSTKLEQWRLTPDALAFARLVLQQLPRSPAAEIHGGELFDMLDPTPGGLPASRPRDPLAHEVGDPSREPWLVPRPARAVSGSVAVPLRDVQTACERVSEVLDRLPPERVPTELREALDAFSDELEGLVLKALAAA